ncbi:hypothetical protein J6590_085583 [Homalodisca vitripennis]|nr:hypothetical protein J6590_085583 [Homalodisca vitripennis]
MSHHTVDVTKAVWANVYSSTPARHNHHYANCTRQDIERHRLYAGSTGSFADCEEYAHLTSWRHDLTGCGVTGLRSDCDTISQTFLILVWPYSNIELVYTLIESSYGLCGQLQDSLASECLHTR